MPNSNLIIHLDDIQNIADRTTAEMLNVPIDSFLTPFLERNAKWKSLCPDIMEYEAEAIHKMVDEVTKLDPDLATLSTLYDTVKFRSAHGGVAAPIILAWEVCTSAAAAQKNVRGLRACSTIMLKDIQQVFNQSKNLKA